MVYQINRIVGDVRVALDENRRGGQLLPEGDMDTLELDTLVKSLIAEAAARVLLVAPVRLLDNGKPVGDSVFWRDRGSGWILLPDDFMRLVVFKMSDWERPVYEPVDADDVRYQVQSSRYKGLRGNPQKPVVAVVNRPEGRALEFYSCRDNSATIERSLYVPYPRFDADGGIEIPERIYRAVVYMTAALAAAVLREGEQAASLSELSNQLLS